jgi:hypothetical protein
MMVAVTPTSGVIGVRALGGIFIGGSALAGCFLGAMINANMYTPYEAKGTSL